MDKRNIYLIIFFLCIFTAVGWLYKDSFYASYFQDDWFSITIGKVQSFPQLLNHFIPRNDVIYYRPLGMQIPFAIVTSLFGLSSFPFHLLTYLTHCLNIILIYFVFKALKTRKSTSLLAAFLYGTSMTHYIPFYWSATYAFVLGPTAFLSSLLLFLCYLEQKKSTWLIYSWIAFSLGLLVYEIIIVLPALLFIAEFLKSRKISIKSYIPYTISALGFLFIRFFLTPPSLEGSYTMGITPHVINNLKGYLLWSFNWPEEMKAQFLNFFTLNPVFVSEFGYYVTIFVTSLITLLLLLYIIPIVYAVQKKSNGIILHILFGIIWFVLGILPVLFFIGHSFSYYLPMSLAGLLYIAAVGIDAMTKGKRVITQSVYYVLIVGVWYVAAVTTIDFNSKIHWAPRRARIAGELIERAKKSYAPSVTDPNIYIAPISENKHALNDQDALKLIFDSDIVISSYSAETKKTVL